MTTMQRKCGLAALVTAGLLLVACGGGGGGDGGVVPVGNTGILQGRVTDQNGNAVVGARVEIANVAVRQTDNQGEFTIGALAPGTYTLNVTKDGYTFGLTTATVVVDRTTTVPITGTRIGVRPQINVVATPPTLTYLGGDVTLDITASDADGDPLVVTATLNGAPLALTNITGNAYQAQVTITGNATTAPVTHTVVVTVNDGLFSQQAQATITVQAAPLPGGAGNSGGNAGGLPIPNI